MVMKMGNGSFGNSLWSLSAIYRFVHVKVRNYSTKQKIGLRLHGEGTFNSEWSYKGHHCGSKKEKLFDVIAGGPEARAFTTKGCTAMIEVWGDNAFGMGICDQGRIFSPAVSKLLSDYQYNELTIEFR